MLPLRARVDLGAMAIKRYSGFPIDPDLLDPHHQIVECHNPGHLLEESYPSAEMQSTVPEN